MRAISQQQQQQQYQQQRKRIFENMALHWAVQFDKMEATNSALQYATKDNQTRK